MIAVDSTTFANLQLFEQFAAASYCQSNNNVTAGGNKLTCQSQNCPLVEADDVVTVFEFQKYAIDLVFPSVQPFLATFQRNGLGLINVVFQTVPVS